MADDTYNFVMALESWLEMQEDALKTFENSSASAVFRSNIELKKHLQYDNINEFFKRAAQNMVALGEVTFNAASDVGLLNRGKQFDIS